MKKFYLKLKGRGLSLLIYSLAFAGINESKSQTYFLNENFSTGSGSTPPTGWTQNLISGNASFDTWRFNNPAGRVGNSPISSPFAIFDSDWYSSGGGAENVALESPSFNTTGFTNVILKWDQYFQTGFGGGAQVEVWNGTSWVSVYQNTTTTTTNPNTQSINISSIAGNKTGVKVRFRWTGDYSWWWIVDNVQVYSILDLRVSGVGLAGDRCGLANDSVYVDISNIGTNPVSNFPVKANVSGTINGNPVSNNLSATYAGTLNAGQNVRVSLPFTDTRNGGTISITGFTEANGDNIRTNDTSKLIGYSVYGTPQAPSASNMNRCGVGPVTLSAASIVASDSIAWYNTSMSTVPLATGNNLNIPFLGTGSHTYYAASYRGLSMGNITTTFAAGNGQQGAMFDLIPNISMRIDSFDVRLPATGSYTIRVYYKTGTFQGFQLNSGAWTSLGDYSFNATATGSNRVKVAPLNVNAGQRYGIYITIVAGPTTLDYTTLGAYTQYSNAAMTIEAGDGISGLFGGTFSPRAWNGTIYYSTPGCVSPRTPVTVNVQALPAGVNVQPSTVFNAKANSSTLADPTIVASPDEMNYELLPPTGYNNAGFGTDWVVSSISFSTLNGSSVPSGDTTTFFPSQNNNARMRFIPSPAATDSLYRLTIGVRDLHTGCDTFITRYIFVAPRPVAGFNAPSVCERSEAAFNSTSSISSGSMSYKWYFGDGDSSVLANPNHRYSSPGNYSVQLIVTSNYGYTNSSTQSYRVKEIPETDFTFQNMCEGAPLTFQNTTLMPAGVATYHWDFGDNATASQNNSSHQYTAAGTYTVIFTVDVDGCSSSISKTVTQAPRAQVNFSSSVSCNNSVASFTNSSSVLFGTLGYLWDFGDGKTSTSSNPNHDYSGFGSFNVKLKAYTNLGCVDSITLPVTLLEAPRIAISHNQPCHGDVVNFINNTSIPAGQTISYEWTLGDGSISTQSNPVHTYSGVGTYNVTLRAVSTNGCEDFFTKAIMVNEKPSVSFNVNDVCDGTPVNFSNNTIASNKSMLNYFWNFGNSTTSTSMDTSILYAAPGSYTVQLIGTLSNGCADTFSYGINVNPIPSAGFTATSSFKGDGSWTFLGPATSGLSYQWFFGDGNRSTLMDPENRYLVDGLYKVTLITTSNKGCTNMSTQDISVLRTSTGPQTEATELVLFPNPNQGTFTLKLTSVVSTPEEVKVYNALGQEIQFRSNGWLNDEMQLDLGSLASGTYQVRVSFAQAAPVVLRFTIK